MFRLFIPQICNFSTKRFILTGAYPCNDLWNDRMNNIDCKISANDLNIKLQAFLNNDTAISALDFDILMNKIDEIDIMNISFITKFVKDFRKTQESLKVFESSSHALIRNFIYLDESYEAFNLLKDRQNTGIFLDEVSVNLLVDKFIVENNWEKAFLTSAEWLLQENFESSKLSISLSFLSCLNFWNNKLWQYKPPVIDVSNLPEEFVFVTYLKNNSFDDHFDLCDDRYRRRLLGKCLCMLTETLKDDSQEDIKYIKWNLKLLGLALHEKLDAVLNHLEKWKQSGNVKFNDHLIAEVLQLIQTCEKTDTKNYAAHPTFKEEEIVQFAERYQALVESSRLKEEVDNRDLIELSSRYFTDKVSEESETETELVRKKYSNFHEYRKEMFENTKQRILSKNILENSKKKMLELTEQEELLSYFEQIPTIMYKSWLAKRTKEEKEYTIVKDDQENLDNLKKKDRKKFVVQHTLE